MKVALLEAGKAVSPKDFTEHVQSWQLKYLGLRSEDPRRTGQFKASATPARNHNKKWFVNDRENPYTQEKPFSWIRQRVVGGRTLSWGRQSYRMSDLDFKAASHDGYGDDWPISYAEMVPYYEKVERYVGISGMAEGLPQLPDSMFLPPMEMTCSELAVRKAIKAKFGPHFDHRPHGDPDESAQRTRGLPLLRTLRARLRHELVFQQPVHDDQGCAEDRPSDSDYECSSRTSAHARTERPRASNMSMPSASRLAMCARRS